MPIQAIPPELLAKMAAAAFHSPALMSGGGGGGGGGSSLGSMPQSQGFNVGQDASKAALALGGLGAQLFKGSGVSNQPETSAVGPGGLSGAVSGIDALKPDANGVWAQPTMPTDIGYGQGGGGWFGNLFGGGLADGGEVVPGKYYTVGERGPETFVPAVPGTIVPSRWPDDYPEFAPRTVPRDDRYYPRGSDAPYYPPAGREAGRDFFGGWPKTRR
jgi:hypothetical protein